MVEERTRIAGLDVIDAGDLKQWGMTLALYGAPGVGKTLRACEACMCQKGGTVLYVGNEGGERSITHLKNKVKIVKPKIWQQIDSLTKVITQNPEPPWFGTIVFDNMSEFQSMNLSMQAGTMAPQIQHYGACTRDLLGFTRRWRDYAERSGINVIFIAWETVEKDELLGVIKRGVGFTPSLANAFPGIIDIVGYMTAEHNKTTRCISFAASNRSSAKFRRSKDEIAMQIPLELYFDLEDMPIVDLLNTLKGGEPFPKAKYQKRGQSTEIKKENPSEG